jgi:hypothetical protein
MTSPWSRSAFLDSQLYRSRRRLRIFSDAPRKGEDMGCLGVHLALTSDEVAKLKSLTSDEDRLAFLQEDLEETYFAEQQHWMCETDKAWDAIHRALTDGRIAYDNGTFPLSHAILGGEVLYFSEDYIMSLKTPVQVNDVSRSLVGLHEPEFRSRYFKIKEAEYGCPVNEEDFAYTWHWFGQLRDFYQRASQQSRFVLFTADQ